MGNVDTITVPCDVEYLNTVLPTTTAVTDHYGCSQKQHQCSFFLLQGRLCSRSKKPLITDQTLLWKLVLQSIKDPSLWIVRGHIAEHE